MKGTLRSALKPSGNEFIGRIPEDWQPVPMKSLGWYASSGIDKKDQEDEPPVLMVNYMDIYGNPNREIDRSRPLMSTTCPAWKVKECNLQQGDLVFTPSSETPKDIGLSALISEDLPNTVFSYHVLRFRFTKPVELGYKKYLCNNSAVLHEFSSVCQGTTRQILNRGEFRNALVSLPPPAEQRAIAEFLDRETGRVDRLVAKKRGLIERLKEKRTALISRTVTRGLRDQNIQLMRLRWLLDRIDTGFTPDSYNFPAQEAQAGVLKSGCVNGGVFDPNENKLLADDVDPPAKLEVKVGDILMSRASGSSELIGSVAQVRAKPAAKLYLSDKTFRLRVNKANCNGAFLVAAMGSTFLRSQLSQIISGAQGLAKNIAQSEMRELLVPAPPLPEQAAIAAYLDEETAKLDALVGKVEEAVERLQEYRTALIAAAVTGKIDVRKLAGATDPSHDAR